MTRKDYILIADALHQARARQFQADRAQGFEAIAHAAEILADVLARDNPRFDQARFLVACGVES